MSRSLGCREVTALFSSLRVTTSVTDSSFPLGGEQLEDTAGSSCK